MRLVVLVLTLTLSLSSFANYPFYHFDKKNVHLSRESFFRYVRPQIRSMIQEYYHLLKKGHPLHGDIILTRSKVAELARNWESWLAECKQINDRCAPMLRDFYKKARELDIILLGIQNSKLNFSSKENTDHTDSILYLSQKIDLLSNLNYKVLHKLEELMITIETNYYYHSTVVNEFRPIYHNMLLNSEMILTSLLEKKFAVEFDSLWVNFMKQMEDHVVQKSDPKYLLDNLGDLNMAWNSFHMRIVKSDLGFPTTRTSVITVMHNRWNSVLKMVMASYKD